MKQRILTGVLLTALLIWLILSADYTLMLVAVCGVASLAYFEYEKMLYGALEMKRTLGTLLYLILLINLMDHSIEYSWYCLWIGFTFMLANFVMFGGEILSKQEPALKFLSRRVLSLFYFPAMFGFLIPIARLEDGRAYLFLYCLIVFGGDTIAYFAGSKIGKRPLAPYLSPKKTLEGSISAVVLATAAPFLCLPLFGWADSYPMHHLIPLLAVSPLMSFLAQAGDLFESLLKRSVEVKDSGSLLPGHGGIMDRLDGLALSAPIYYFVISQLQAGQW